MVSLESRIGLLSCWLFSIFLIGPAQPSDSPENNSVLHEFEIGTSTPWLIVPLAVESQRLPFVIDTGASVGVYDDTLKTLLGALIRKATIKSSPSGPRDVELFESPEATIGTLRLPTNSTVFLFDLKPASRATRCEVRGIVGMNQMRGMLWQIDCDNGKVRVLSRVPTEPGNEVAITYAKTGTPHVACTVAKSVRGSFLIDTGSSQSIILEQRLFDSLVASRHIHIVGQSANSDGNGRLWFGTVGRLHDFSVGDVSLKEVSVVRGGRNLIGMSFLSRFVTTLDFPNGKAYLKPGRQFDKRDARVIRGFDVFFAGDDLQVVTLEAGGSADKAGLKLNDVIEEIDGAKIVGKSLFELQRAIEKPGDEVTLSVRRGDDIINIKIVIPALAM